jgi:hypothetical protein
MNVPFQQMGLPEPSGRPRETDRAYGGISARRRSDHITRIEGGGSTRNGVVDGLLDQATCNVHECNLNLERKGT